LTDPAPYIAAFGPVAGVLVYLWINRAQKPPPQSDDPMRSISSKLDAIRDDLTDVFSLLSDISKDTAVLKDRGKN